MVLMGLQLLLTLYMRMNSLVPVEPAVEKVEAFNPKLFEVMSFGQLPAIVDWMWIRSLQDPLITHVTRGTHPAIFYTLDLITDLDPAFKEAYIGGSTLLSVIRDDGDGALRELLKAQAFRKGELPHYSKEFKELYWADDWQVPFLAAYVYVFDLQDMPHASLMFRETAKEPGSPLYLKDLVKKLDQPGGQYEICIKLIDFLLKSEKDARVRDRLTRSKDSLKVNYFVFGLNDGFEKFLTSNKIKVETLGDKKRESLFEKYMKVSHTLWTDPWGGHLSIDDKGRINTSTPHGKAFGLR
jgi:hypothetical protein